MREINKIAEGLFEKIRDRFEDVSLGEENANSTQNPEDARFFNFDYVIDGNNYGNITISIIDETSLKVYFSKNISSELEGENRKQWYGFLKELREFAKRNLLSFEPRDITRATLKHRDIQQVSKADTTYDKNEVIGESQLYGTRRSSYENDGPVRIIIRHSDQIDPERKGARARKIRAIYLENSDGERLKLPHNSLRYARAMARHCAEGGSINDEFGNHITEIAEECGKLKPFKAAMIRRVFEDEETHRMVEAAFEYHSLLKDTLNKMSGRKGYSQCKEQFVHTSTSYIPEEDFDADSLKERFVKRTYNERMDDALPIVYKAYNMKKTNKMAEAFESWANRLAEGTWALPDSEDEVNELIELFGNPLPVGVDAQNATNALYNLIGDDKLFDRLGELAEQDPEADARDVIAYWLQDNLPNIYQQIANEIGDPDVPAEPAEVGDEDLQVDEGNTYGAGNGGMDGVVYEDETDQDDLLANIETIQSAIIRRILNNINDHSELLKKAGPEGIMNAASDVASFHAPMEEIGSSDISIMVREVYNEAGVEYPEMHEAKDKVTYDPKTGKLTGWEHEGDWKKRTKKKDPVGKIHHMSDVARRQTEKMADKTLEEAFEKLVNEAAINVGDMIKDKTQPEIQGKVVGDMEENYTIQVDDDIYHIKKLNAEKVAKEAIEMPDNPDYSKYDEPTFKRQQPKIDKKLPGWAGYDLDKPAFQRKAQYEKEREQLKKLAGLK